MSEKHIDGYLPCLAHETCPLAKECGGTADYKAPNTKKLMCLMRHIDALAYELYKRDEPNHNCTLSDYAYQMAWIMHNELQDTAELIAKWEEPKHSPTAFLKMYASYESWTKSHDITFLQATSQHLKAIATVLNGLP